MRTILLTVLLLIAMACTVFAGEVYSSKILDNYSGLAATARYSRTVNYGQYVKKSVSIGGVHASGAFAPYSGVVALQGASSATGPWVPLKDKAGNVVTATGNATFDLDSMVPFVRAVWTRTKHRVTVWMHYSN